MSKDDLVYVGHMLDLATSAVSKTESILRESFDADENLRLALTHLIQMIGEAARHVSEEFRARHSEIPWRQIVGMRHKVVHDYMHVDYDMVWDVATVDLPPLIRRLERIVSAPE